MANKKVSNLSLFLPSFSSILLQISKAIITLPLALRIMKFNIALSLATLAVLFTVSALPTEQVQATGGKIEQDPFCWTCQSVNL